MGIKYIYYLYWWPLNLTIMAIKLLFFILLFKSCVLLESIWNQVIIMALINLNGHWMVIKFLIYGFFMPLNLPNHLFVAISLD